MRKNDSLVFAFLFDGEGGGREIGWDEVASWTPEEGVLWLHMNSQIKRTAYWLRRKSGLDPVIAKAMVEQDSRPRSVLNHRGLMVTLRGVNLNPSREPQDMVSTHIWIEASRIITTRRYRLLSVADIRASLHEGYGPKTPGQFLSQLNEHLIDRMTNVLTQVDETIDELEEEVLLAQDPRSRGKLADLRRQIVVLRRYLAPQREALSQLSRSLTPLIQDNDRLQLRESSNRIQRFIEDLDATRERAAITQEELTSQLSEQINQRMYILSLVAVVFLPLTFVTGLLGINVGGIPGANYTRAFWLVCLCLLVCMILIVWYFRRKHWLS